MPPILVKEAYWRPPNRAPRPCRGRPKCFAQAVLCGISGKSSFKVGCGIRHDLTLLSRLKPARPARRFLFQPIQVGGRSRWIASQLGFLKKGAARDDARRKGPFVDRHSSRLEARALELSMEQSRPDTRGALQRRASRATCAKPSCSSGGDAEAGQGPSVGVSSR